MEGAPVPPPLPRRRRRGSPARQLLVVGLIAAGLLGVGYLATRSGREKEVDRHVEELSRKVTPDSTADAQEAIVDEDYRFRIEWPGEGWKLLREAEIGRLNPQAAAGAMGERGSFGMVLVEELPAPDTDLEEWANLLMGNFLPAGEEPIQFGPVRFAGQRAIRYHIRAKVGEVDLRVINHVFFHQGFAYQVAGTCPAPWTRPDGRDLKPFFDAFSLLPGPVKGRSAEQILTDARGVGWEVRDGVYESGAFGLRIEPPEGWRIELGESIESYSEGAEFVLTSQSPELWIAVTPEATRGVDPDAYRRRMTQWLGEDFEPLPGTWEYSFLGRSLSFERFRESTVYESDYLLGLARDGDLHFLILAGSATASADRAKDRLREAIAAIERLPPEERQELSRRQLDMGNPQDAVGTDWCWRRGRLRDFRERLEWSSPEGFWKVTAGEQARLEHDEDTVFVAEEPALGLHAFLTVYPLQELDPDLHHRGVVEEWAGYAEIEAEGGGVDTIPFGGGMGRASWLEGGEEGMEHRYRILSTVYGGRGVQLVVRGYRGNMAAAETTVALAAEGLILHEGEFEPATRTGSRVVDRRMGFSLDLPGYRFSPYAESEFHALGSAWTGNSGRRTVMVFAVCAADPSLDMGWLTEVVTQLIRERASDSQRAISTRARSTLAGLPCDRLTFDGARSKAEVLLLRRDLTFYALLISTADPSGEPAEVESLKRGFRLLD